MFGLLKRKSTPSLQEQLVAAVKCREMAHLEGDSDHVSEMDHLIRCLQREILRVTQVNRERHAGVYREDLW